MMTYFKLLFLIYCICGQHLIQDNIHAGSRICAVGKDVPEIVNGAIIRGDRSSKKLALVFTGHEYADGAQVIIATLKRYNIKASFFFTGSFYRNQNFSNIIKTLRNQDHYLGAHSNEHLLYCDWQERDSLLLSKSEFTRDLMENYQIMEEYDITKDDALYFLPPYEWYNTTIALWTSECGFNLINHSPGTLSHADYTYPEMGDHYYDSEQILESIYKFEREDQDGLNGFILLMHIGVSPHRKDRFYDHLNVLIQFLLDQGYYPVRINELLDRYIDNKYQNND